MTVHQVDFSLRFNSADSAYASLTPAAGTQDKWKISVWVKRGKLGTAATIISADTSSDDVIYFGSSDKLFWNFAGTTRLVSTAVFRDPTAWYYFEFIYDAANATAANRARVFVFRDGALTEITAWDTDTRSSITTGTSKINTNVVHNIGREAAGATNYFDGYLSHVALVDNSVTTGFGGSVNSTTGGWDPKAISGAKWWLKWEDNADTTSAHLGKDSGSDATGWTCNNFSVTAGVGNDSLTDTPTNSGTDTGAGGEVTGNYCTASPIDRVTSHTLTNGNLTVTTSASGTWNGGARATQWVNSGKYYWTAKFSALVSAGLGVANAASPMTSNPGSTINEFVWFNNGPLYNAGEGSVNSGYTTANEIGFALDLDSATPTLKYYLDGVLQPYYHTLVAGTYYSPYGGAVNGSGSWDYNFGQRPFTHAAPAGYKTFCTANLPTPAVPNPATNFVSVLAAGTSDAISTALAAARAGWSSYVDVLKVRDTTGGWKWRFSHDASNEYTVSTTASYAAKAAPSANNWVGYSVKVDGTAGVKAGSQAHTNGAGDTTVTHNSGVSARQLILLFPRGDGEVLMYHPDAASGELLYLTGTEADFASTLIKSVTANAFTIDSTHASDTYDYLVIPELDGFFKLFGHTGNASADGPFLFLGLLPALMGIKVNSTTGNHFTWDNVRETYNPRAAELLLNTTAAQGSTADIDFTAFGAKIRATTAGYNGNGATHVGWAFAETAGKYSAAIEATVPPTAFDTSSATIILLP